MTGREETDLKNKQRSMKLIAKLPYYMEDFYYYMYDSSEISKYQIISYVKKYLEYLSKLGKDILDIETFKTVKETDIRKYMDASLSDVSKKSQGNNLIAIKKFFAYLESDGLIEKSYIRNLALPKDRTEKPITYLNPDEIKLMVKNAMVKKTDRSIVSRDILVISLMLELGLRRGSVSELNMEDIDLENRTIHIITKGNYERTLPFGEKIAERINDYLIDRENILKDKPDNPAFLLSNRGNRLSTEAINDIVKVNSLGINGKHITAHKLRATCATTVYEETNDVYRAAKLLGHHNIASTAKYANVSEERLRGAANIMEELL